MGTGDHFISTMFMSKHQALQRILLGEIVFDNDFRKIKKIQNDGKESDDVFIQKIKSKSQYFYDIFYGYDSF